MKTPNLKKDVVGKILKKIYLHKHIYILSKISKKEKNEICNIKLMNELIEKNKKNKTENNTENELILLINDKKKRFIKLPHENNKNNYIKSVRTIKKSNDLKHKELNNDRSLSKNHFFKDSDGKNKMNKKFIRNRQIKTKGKKMEIKKKYEQKLKGENTGEKEKKVKLGNINENNNQKKKCCG